MKPQITDIARSDARTDAPASKELRHEAADHELGEQSVAEVRRASKELRHEAADHADDLLGLSCGGDASKELRHEAADHGPIRSL